MAARANGIPPPGQGARSILEREIVTVKMTYGLVRVKAARSNGMEVNPAPEFEDCRRLAGEKNVPLKEVIATACAAFRNKIRF